MSKTTDDSVDDTIQQLKADAPNEQVVSLLTVIQRQHQEITTLRDSVEDLRQEMKRVRNATGIDSDPDTESPHFDERDRRVLESFAEENPDIVYTSEIHDRYKKLTDIRQKSTLKTRTGIITEHGPFDHVGVSRWEYDPETESD